MWSDLYWPIQNEFWPLYYWPIALLILEALLENKYDVPYYDRNFIVSEYNRKHTAQKDLTWKLEDTEG